MQVGSSLGILIRRRLNQQTVTAYTNISSSTLTTSLRHLHSNLLASHLSTYCNPPFSLSFSLFPVKSYLDFYLGLSA
jgi:hypothetical protein